MARKGMLINYDYCTGCHTCEVACRVEHGFPDDQGGVAVAQTGPWEYAPDRYQFRACPSSPTSATSAPSAGRRARIPLASTTARRSSCATATRPNWLARQRKGRSRCCTFCRAARLVRARPSARAVRRVCACGALAQRRLLRAAAGSARATGGPPLFRYDGTRLVERRDDGRPAHRLSVRMNRTCWNPRGVVSVMERAEKGAADPAAETKQKKAGQQEAASGPALLPLCDVAGYACFVTWAFVVGWDRGVSPLGGRGELDFFVCRCALFAGVACATCVLFLLGGSVLAGSRERLRTVAFPLLCMALAVPLFVRLPGMGRSGALVRRRHRDRPGRSSCGGRASGCSPASNSSTPCAARSRWAAACCRCSPSSTSRSWLSTVALLPLASYVLLLFAHRQYDGEEGPSAKREASFIEGGVRRLRTQIPFEEDRKFIVLKGLFALLYSVSLGFAACALARQLAVSGKRGGDRVRQRGRRPASWSPCCADANATCAMCFPSCSCRSPASATCSWGRSGRPKACWCVPPCCSCCSAATRS